MGHHHPDSSCTNSEACLFECKTLPDSDKLVLNSVHGGSVRCKSIELLLVRNEIGLQNGLPLLDRHMHDHSVVLVNTLLSETPHNESTDIEDD